MSENYSTRIGIIGSEGHLGSIIKDRLSYVYPNVWGINGTRWDTSSEAKHFIRSMDILILCVRPADIEKVMLTIDSVLLLKGKVVFDSQGKKVGKVVDVIRPTNSNNFTDIVVKEKLWSKPKKIPKEKLAVYKKNIILK